ncbi:MAG: hypothetical protein QOJ35_2814 [Solirubrobacteraceae bacterium]|nr:hypothetical protein [Solirubrobacteraceae bacterium]
MQPSWGKSGRLASAPMPPPAGLCDSCRHQRVIRNTRGSSFSLCERSRDDDRYPKYPRLPVLRCPGHERRDEQPDASP